MQLTELLFALTKSCVLHWKELVFEKKNLCSQGLGMEIFQKKVVRPQLWYKWSVFAGKPKKKILMMDCPFKKIFLFQNGLCFWSWLRKRLEGWWLTEALVGRVESWARLSWMDVKERVNLKTKYHSTRGSEDVTVLALALYKCYAWEMSA